MKTTILHPSIFLDELLSRLEENYNRFNSRLSSLEESCGDQAEKIPGVDAPRGNYPKQWVIVNIEIYFQFLYSLHPNFSMEANPLFRHFIEKKYVSEWMWKKWLNSTFTDWCWITVISILLLKWLNCSVNLINADN